MYVLNRAGRRKVRPGGTELTSNAAMRDATRTPQEGAAPA